MSVKIQGYNFTFQGKQLWSKPDGQTEVMHTKRQGEDYEGSYPENTDKQSDDWMAIWWLQLSKLSTSILEFQGWNCDPRQCSTQSSKIISISSQPDILLQLPHQGVEKTSLWVRTAIFWVEMNRDIEYMVTKCLTCQKCQTSTPPEALLQHETPSHPWQKISSQTSSCHHSTTSVSVIRYMIFEEQGISKGVFSDSSINKEFASFANKFSFKHTSSSHYPQSNGLRERMIGACKKLLLKAPETGTVT